MRIQPTQPSVPLLSCRLRPQGDSQAALEPLVEAGGRRLCHRHHTAAPQLVHSRANGPLNPPLMAPAIDSREQRPANSTVSTEGLSTRSCAFTIFACAHRPDEDDGQQARHAVAEAVPCPAAIRVPPQGTALSVERRRRFHEMPDQLAVVLHRQSCFPALVAKQNGRAAKDAALVRKTDRTQLVAPCSDGCVLPS